MYIVIELQTNANGQVGNIVTAYDTLAQAQNKYYTICAYAAVSSIPIHTAIILDSTGMSIAQQCFRHPLNAEGEIE